MGKYHTSVLLSEVVEHLQIETGKTYIDATLGGAGHTIEFIRNGGRVLGIDQDEEALRFSKNAAMEEKLDTTRYTFIYGNFKDIKRLAQENGFEHVDGILFDLGVSGHQFDDSKRGFSFTYDGPLDMRMDTSLSVRAADLINGLSVDELTRLFERFGEERQAKKIAKHIVDVRREKLFETTKELAERITEAVGNYEKIHPATRVFQALRIAVNDELFSIEHALPEAFSLLKPGGRLAVISFHSLEDRIVKRSFQSFVEANSGRLVTKKPVTPTEEEMRTNRRSRSAKMRVIEKL